MTTKSKLRGIVLPTILLIGLGLFYVSWNSAEPTPTEAARPNILLISIDTCRADRLSCYGYDRKTTPNIDAIAAEGSLFRHAVAPTSVTLPSHSSMLTGTLPPFHGVHDNQIYRLADANVTLTEVLKENGYDTGAIVGTFVLDPKFGLAQGFDFYDATMTTKDSSSQQVNERRAGEINRVAKQWLSERTDTPFFLFLHYYDPHFPYEPPPPFDSEYAGDPYAGEIAYVDQQIGEIRDELIRTGLYESTMIIVTSDHGESLHEHGEPTHGWFIYNATTHVPLIIKFPHTQKSEIVEEKVALIDLAPTVLGQIGIDIPGDMYGIDLTANETKRPGTRSQRLFFAESLHPSRYGCTSLLAMQNQQWKYIQSAKPELYDLQDDPKELNNLYATKPDAATPLQSALQEFLARRIRTDLVGAKQATDPENMKRLEGLGYVGGGQAIEYTFATDKKDAKDFLPTYSELMRANHLVLNNPDGSAHTTNEAGQPIQIQRAAWAEQICQQILQEDPDVSKAHELLGRMAQRNGRLEEAARRYGHLIRINPDFAAAHIDLGSVLKSLGKLGQAEEHYRTAIDILTRAEEKDNSVEMALDRLRSSKPLLVLARQALAQLLMDEDRIEESATEFRALLELEPQYVMAHTVIALDYFQKKHLDEAVQALERALAIDPDYKPALRMMASIKKARGS